MKENKMKLFKVNVILIDDLCLSRDVYVLSNELYDAVVKIKETLSGTIEVRGIEFLADIKGAVDASELLIL
jgi:hypothetical protein